MISVLIGTYGDKPKWEPFARRAMDSARMAGEVIWYHGETLADARNRAATAAKYSRLVFLDADDELAPGFFDRVIECEDVLQPKTVYRQDGIEGPAHWIEPAEDFLIRNHIVVGAPVNRELFLDSGGFEEYAIAEDWALWLKLRSMGATFGRTEATYIVNVNPHGRNAGSDWSDIDRIRERFR